MFSEWNVSLGSLFLFSTEIRILDRLPPTPIADQHAQAAIKCQLTLLVTVLAKTIVIMNLVSNALKFTETGEIIIKATHYF